MYELCADAQESSVINNAFSRVWILISANIMVVIMAMMVLCVCWRLSCFIFISRIAGFRPRLKLKVPLVAVYILCVGVSFRINEFSSFFFHFVKMKF